MEQEVSLITILAPYIEVVVMAAVTALLTWIATRFQQWTGMNIEAKHREALQSALHNGVKYALREVPPIAPRGEKVLKVLEYLRGSVPDALAYFEAQGLSPEVLHRLIEPHLPMEGSNAEGSVAFSSAPKPGSLRYDQPGASRSDL